MISIIGAGGHTRTLIHIIHLNGLKIEGIYEEVLKEKDEKILGYQVKQLEELENQSSVIISKGSVQSKEKYTRKFESRLLTNNLIHPNACIESQEIGIRNQIAAQTYLSLTSVIGNDNVIYSGSIIEHESHIGNNNMITVGVSICGRVHIGNNCFLGAGSTILPGISLCDNVVIGAGAVVTKDINSPGTYVGLPAKKMDL